MYTLVNVENDGQRTAREDVAADFNFPGISLDLLDGCLR